MSDRSPHIKPKDPAPPLAYTLPMFTARLNISRSHAYALIAAQKIKIVKIGGRTLITAAEVERLLSEGA
jgi:excisionase family DNA binding protein